MGGLRNYWSLCLVILISLSISCLTEARHHPKQTHVVSYKDEKMKKGQLKHPQQYIPPVLPTPLPTIPYPLQPPVTPSPLIPTPLQPPSAPGTILPPMPQIPTLPNLPPVPGLAPPTPTLPVPTPTIPGVSPPVIPLPMPPIYNIVPPVIHLPPTLPIPGVPPLNTKKVNP